METTPNITLEPKHTFPWRGFLQSLMYFIIGLAVFFFSLDLMMAALQRMGSVVTDTLLLATSNPFTGLFIGLLLSALIQSSSATTSITVVLVASGSLSLSSAVPLIMGANIGTTITSTIVSLSFISHKKEFRRAITSGTYHAFFNILTALILFPLEYYFHFLSGLSQFIAVRFFHEPAGSAVETFSLLGAEVSSPVNFISAKIGNAYFLAALSVVLLLGSMLFFRKMITNALGVSAQEKLRKLIFNNSYKSFGWGLFITAAIRSSTVTTSLIVPLTAKKIIRLRTGTAFILGANIGTTITAFLVSAFNSYAAISIAWAHFLFNFIGVIIFFRTPYLKEVPYQMATQLGKLTLRYRVAGFLFLLLTFFLIPFSLIYLYHFSM